MHIFESRFLRRGEVWFDQKPDPTTVDWICFRQCPNRLPGGKWKPFYTLLVNLENSPEALLESFDKSVRSKIRRARDGDKVVCERVVPVTKDILNTFAHVYKMFTAVKGLGSLDLSRLEQFSKEGCLDVSIARSPEGTILVYHVYYRGTRRSRLLHSVSLHDAIADSHIRNAMARANCLLTWCDMLRHKEEGLKHFDFGGWYPGTADQARLGINRFKEGFGGKVVRENNGRQILTLKARVVLSLGSLLERGKTVFRKSRAAQAKHSLSNKITIDATQPKQSEISPAVR